MARSFGNRGVAKVMRIDALRARDGRHPAASRAKARAPDPVRMLAVVTIVCAMAALWMSREPIADHVASWAARIEEQREPRVANRPAAMSRDTVATPGRPTRSIVPCARNCVTDGDTFRLGEERIRIVNIDAPELRGRCAEETRLANKAKRRLRDLIEGRTILVERQGKDRFGRTLAEVSAGGRDVGQRLVAEGLARPWTGSKEQWCRV